MSTSQKQATQRLMELIRQGNVEETLKLLKSVETWGWKALRDALYAAVKDETVFTSREDQLALTTALLDAGAGVNALYGRHGTTPLHIAARRGNLELVALLLARGQDVNASEDGRKMWQKIPEAITSICARQARNGAGPNGASVKNTPSHVCASTSTVICPNIAAPASPAPSIPCVGVLRWRAVSTVAVGMCLSFMRGGVCN